MTPKISKTMRLLHRYLGFLLLIIMAIYAFTGIVLIYRDTATFKRPVFIEKNLPTDLSEQQLGQLLRIRNLTVTAEKDGTLYFKEGEYHQASGNVKYHAMEYPTWLAELNRLHLGNSQYRYSWLTTLFAIALLFFCFSGLWLMPRSEKVIKRSLFFILSGFLLTLFLIFTD